MATEYYTGNRSSIAMALESTYGTVNSASTWSWLGGYVDEVTMSHSRNLEELTPMDNDNLLVGEYYPGTLDVGFTIKQKLQHLRMLAVALGSDSVTGSSPYTHAITKANTLPSFSLKALHNHSSAPSGSQIVGGMVKKWDLTFPKGDWINLSLDCVGQNVTKITSMPSYQASVDSMKKYTNSSLTNFRSTNSEFVIDGVNWAPYIQQATLSGDNALLVDPTVDKSVGNELIAEPSPELGKFDASFTVKMKDSTLDDLWIAGEAVDNCYFKCYRGTQYLKADFTGTMIESANAPFQIGGGVVVQTLNMKIPSVAFTDYNAIETDYLTVEA
jgi:hypothetical protein